LKWVSWGLWGLAAATVAIGAPPQSRVEMPTRSNARAEPLTVSRLDLRAPTNWPSEAGKSGSTHALAVVDTPPFPSMRRRSDDAAGRGLQEDPPSVGSELPAMRTMSRAQEMARRFRSEGLPVARLFESRSALVSLGLNQRGKPGIWLIQKLP
jgi:hypothetical protein